MFKNNTKYSFPQNHPTDHSRTFSHIQNFHFCKFQTILRFLFQKFVYSFAMLFQSDISLKREYRENR